ncbi:L-xylulose reductase-like protein [Drosera capensis]
MATHVTGHQLEPWWRLDDKVVMVTGASSGLGREFCVDLARAGCRIIAAARRTDRLKSLCDEMNQLSSSGASRAVAVELDVAGGSKAIEASVQKAWDMFGCIHALINNAGVRGTVSSTLELSEEEWDDTFATNLKGTWLVSKFVCTRMRDANIQGSVVNITSVSGLNRVLFPGSLAYSASKAAVHTSTKVMALELGEFKIRVNSIAPGIFKSDITGKLMEKPWLKNYVSQVVPLKDLGTTDPALSSLVRYLIHDESNYVTGNIFVVESGLTLPGIPLQSSL